MNTLDAIAGLTRFAKAINAKGRMTAVRKDAERIEVLLNAYEVPLK